MDFDVVIIGGGPSGLSAALALGRGRKRVLLVSTDPAHSTSDMFERAIGPEIVPLLPSLHGLEIDGEFESRRYVAEVKEHIKDLFGPNILKEAHRQIDLAVSELAAGLGRLAQGDLSRQIDVPFHGRLEQLRQDSSQNLPCGSDEFVAGLEAVSGKPMRWRPRGRPIRECAEESGQRRAANRRRRRD